MMTIDNWTARRSGAAMTLTGTMDGVPMHAAGVASIDLADGGVIATLSNGHRYRLATVATPAAEPARAAA